MTNIDSFALPLHLFSCFFMTGVSLLIQLTHYPSFAQIDSSKFLEFHRQHSNALGILAGPAMAVELITAFWLASSTQTLWFLNALGVLALWAITFLISVPCHQTLSQGFNEAAWRRLVRTNWLRTAIWTLRSLALFVWLSLHLQS